MAVGTKSDFKIYHEEFFSGLVETLQQNTAAFNAASRNAIRLVPRRMRGDYEKASFMRKISGLVARRDPTSTSSVTDTALTQGEHVGVKVNRRIGPVSDTLDAFRKIAEDPAVFSYLLGQQIGPDVAADYLNTALRAARAALNNVSALKHDATDGTIETTDIVRGLSKFGDAAGRISCLVMHSKPYFDLVTDQITDNIFEVSGFVVREGSPVTLNRPVIVTDSDALVVANGVSSGVDAYYTLGLVTDGVEVAQSEDEEIVSQLVTGEENLRMRIQGEHAFNVKLAGFSWDITNGGANPADAAIATGSNWDQIVTSTKQCAGMVIASR